MNDINSAAGAATSPAAATATPAGSAANTPPTANLAEGAFAAFDQVDEEADDDGTEHQDVAIGREPPAMSLVSALAIEAAQKRVGCETPPSAQAVIDDADPEEVAAARAEIDAQPVLRGRRVTRDEPAPAPKSKAGRKPSAANQKKG